MAIYVWHRRESGLVTQPAYKLIITEHQTREYVSFKHSFSRPQPLEEMLWLGEGGFLGKGAPLPPSIQCPLHVPILQVLILPGACIKQLPIPTLAVPPQASGLTLGRISVFQVRIIYYDGEFGG